jgi:hypothetical protein
MCSGNGQCMSKRQAAKYRNFVHTFNQTDYGQWDGDMIYGCFCSPGWTGPACDKRTCAFGYDPLNYTFPWTPSVDQVQLLECNCAFSDCSGGIRLKFKDAYTGIIPALSAAQGLTFMLKQVIEFDGRPMPQGKQLENWVINNASCRKTGSKNSDVLERVYQQYEYKGFWGNFKSYLNEGEFNSVTDASESILKVKNIDIYKNENNKWKIDFEWDGARYPIKRISLTDPDYYGANQSIHIENAYIVTSIPKEPDWINPNTNERQAYKFVSKIYILDL